MLKLFVARCGFQRVSECVAVIQDFAQARFALIVADNLCLNLDGATNDMFEGSMIARQDPIHVLLEEREQFSVRDHAVLDDLGQARRGILAPAKLRKTSGSTSTRLGG